MTATSIRAVGLGKRYAVGIDRRPNSVREAFAQCVTGPWRRFRQLSGWHGESETIWALRGVDLDIPAGNVVGIIGHNGSGKSTLLKIASRITPPSEGELTLYGRVSSLLEVGTGFHPELTGRENIYLNGCICGMKRAEIRRKFDEIVEYAEIGPFLDTPIKRYSSGMRVRLAFSVASHLEPEILAIDEVLAVGDARFQAKCLGQMGRAARGGQTVLFVSHNMQAVRTYCEVVHQLEAGRLVRAGSPAEVVSRYLAESSNSSTERHWAAGDAPGDERIRLRSVRVDAAGRHGCVCRTSRELSIQLNVDILGVGSPPYVGFDIVTSDGITVLRSFQGDGAGPPALAEGQHRLTCRVPSGLLNGGRYHVAVRIGRPARRGIEWVVHLDAAVSFDMELDHGSPDFWMVRAARGRVGVVAPILQWAVTPADEGVVTSPAAGDADTDSAGRGGMAGRTDGEDDDRTADHLRTPLDPPGLPTGHRPRATARGGGRSL